MNIRLKATQGSNTKVNHRGSRIEARNVRSCNSICVHEIIISYGYS